MKTLRFGLVGTGWIGKFHMDRLANKISDAELVAVYDYKKELAEQAVKELNVEAKIYENDTELINADNVDAIVVATPGFAHKDTVLKAIRAGKYVFVEKPLATTVEDCLEIVEAEQQHGSKLVQVGFMRRYDKGYIQMKEAIDTDLIGEPLMIVAAHRNPAVDENYTTDMAINDTLIHEIDALHWLVGDDYESIQVTFPKKSSYALEHLKDPQIITMTTKSGIVMTVQVSVNIQYGYDIQCEVVGEKGVVSLPEIPTIQYRTEEGLGQKFYHDFQERFGEAFDEEFINFVKSIQHDGKPAGPSAWDGYVATTTVEAGIKSQKTEKTEKTELQERPKFYN